MLAFAPADPRTLHRARVPLSAEATVHRSAPAYIREKKKIVIYDSEGLSVRSLTTPKTKRHLNIWDSGCVVFPATGGKSLRASYHLWRRSERSTESVTGPTFLRSLVLSFCKREDPRKCTPTPVAQVIWSLSHRGTSSKKLPSLLKDRKLSLEQEVEDSLKAKVHELEASSTDLREKLEMSMRRPLETLERSKKKQDNLWNPPQDKLAVKERLTLISNSPPMLMRFPKRAYSIRTSSTYIAGAKMVTNSVDKSFDVALTSFCGRDDFNSAFARTPVDLNLSPSTRAFQLRGDASEHGKLWDLLQFLDDIRVNCSIDDPLSAEALLEPPTEVPATNVLSTVVIVPPADPSISVED
ncbi:hypothetical protein Tco_0672544 [Tanacetum coccineum]